MEVLMNPVHVFILILVSGNTIAFSEVHPFKRQIEEHYKEYNNQSRLKEDAAEINPKSMELNKGTRRRISF
jgi:hypothetical protein